MLTLNSNSIVNKCHHLKFSFLITAKCNYMQQFYYLIIPFNFEHLIFRDAHRTSVSYHSTHKSHHASQKTQSDFFFKNVA
jgi:hypothetical protein